MFIVFNQPLLVPPFESEIKLNVTKYNITGNPEVWGFNNFGLLRNANRMDLYVRKLLKLSELDVTKNVLQFKYKMRSNINVNLIKYDIEVSEWNSQGMVLKVLFEDPSSVSVGQLLD